MKAPNKLIESCITPDFPKTGVKFIDIFPFISNTYSRGFRKIRKIARNYPIVFVPEARGFLFYESLGPTKVVPLRKANKLPGNVVPIPYQKEYGSDTLYYQPLAVSRALQSYVISYDAKFIPVLVFDDLAATFGTAKALVEHINSLSFNGVPLKVVEFASYIELTTEFPNRRKVLEDLGVKVTAIYEY